METNNHELHPLLRRAIIYLENEDWGSADDCCERYLDFDPENAYAYVIKLMARVKVNCEEDLFKASHSFRKWNSYQNAYRFSDSDMRARLEKYADNVEEKLRLQEEENLRILEEQKNKEIYDKARINEDYCNVQGLKEAIKLYESLLDFQDSRQRASECKEKLVQEEKKRAQSAENRRIEKKKKENTIIAICISVTFILLLVIFYVGYVISSHRDLASRIEGELIGLTFHGTYYSDTKASDGGGTITTLTEMTLNEVTYKFEGKNRVNMEETKKYDKEPFITKNGERQWDSVYSRSLNVDGGEVNVSLFGKITVIIRNQEFVVHLDDNEHPIAIEFNEVVYNKCSE